jgi:tetratricopeptide (TPR) repeat protein
VDELAVRRAKKLLEAGLVAVEAGQLEVARQNFKSSSENFPSADALTYWGWMEHHAGKTDFAIELCQRAIEKDPGFGNPYNDIGSYLLQLGKLDEAIAWLEKALKAERYEPRQYPHINLGRVYLAKGLPLKAISHFRAALELDPENPEVLRTLREILSSLN